MPFIRIKLIIILAIVWSYSLPLCAATKKTTYTAIGDATCLEWNEERNKGSRGKDGNVGIGELRNRAWLMGYITGASHAFAEEGVDVFQDIDYLIVLDWTDRYCASNPSDKLSGAMAKLVLQIFEVKLRQLKKDKKEIQPKKKDEKK